MLTLGSVSSKYWMNGLPQIPHSNLSRLTSDHYNSIGSWFVDGTPTTTATATATSSKHSLNRRPQPVSSSSSSSHPMAMAVPPPAMPLASSTTTTVSTTAPTTTTGTSQQQQPQQHRDSLYSTNANNSTNNFSINDLTMTSLTDSVRNMLSIVGNHEGGSLSGLLMTGGWTRSSGSVSQTAAVAPEGQQVPQPQPSHDSVTLAEPKSSDPSPRMGILAADFYTPPPSSYTVTTTVHPPPPPPSS